MAKDPRPDSGVKFFASPIWEAWPALIFRRIGESALGSLLLFEGPHDCDAIYPSWCVQNPIQGAIDVH